MSKTLNFKKLIAEIICPNYFSSFMDSGKVGDDGTTIEFNHFDSVPLATDHKYLNCSNAKGGKNCFNNASIMREWRILQGSLPDSIYVQVYETRMDLLRAVIIGPAETPYHDGLFFFDIVLPSDYPNQPPQVYYHSHGYRLNPNLYENGAVCLSLINTWPGKNAAEKWTKKSTILQLLVSLQGLVLNDTPFFNEPVFRIGRSCIFSWWKSPPIRYNEAAFILSCMTMLKVFQHPPKNFEAFVAQHFRQHAASLLAAIEHYKQGLAMAGHFEMNAAASSSYKPLYVSSKFKSDLRDVQAQLNRAFAPFIPRPSKASTTTLKAITQVKERRYEKDESSKQQQKGLLQRTTIFAQKIFK